MLMNTTSSQLGRSVVSILCYIYIYFRPVRKPLSAHPDIDMDTDRWNPHRSLTRRTAQIAYQSQTVSLRIKKIYRLCYILYVSLHGLFHIASRMVQGKKNPLG